VIVGVQIKNVSIKSKLDQEVHAVVFWAAKTWSLLHGYQHFGKNMCLYPSVYMSSLKMEAADASEKCVSTYVTDYNAEDHKFNI